MNAKEAAARRACEFVEDGMTVGLGTGSTAAYAVKRLGERVAEEGLKIQGIPTSEETMRLARHVNVPLVTLDDVQRVDVTIDGADEVDPRLDLIKGLGGALLREKVVAFITDKQVIIVDEGKMVERLGEKAPLPVEVVRFAVPVVKRRLEEMGWEATLRVKDDETFLTDNGNHVLDVRFPDGALADDPRRVERVLNNIPGVVDNGLFLGLTWKVVVGADDGATRLVEKSG